MPQPSPADQQERLIRAVAQSLPQPVSVVETHISWVLLAAGYAYKFKKALRFDFLDFSTLEARRYCCQEEVRLNRRLAPELYLGVVAVTGAAQRPVLGGPGAALDYAVRMRAFPQHALWSARIGAGLLSAAEIDDLAQQLAAFHKAAPAASADSPWGAPTALRGVAEDSLRLLASLARGAGQEQAVAAVQAWHDSNWPALAPVFALRKAGGHVREGHGDLHSGNIITADGRVRIFDCIEFSPALRWIDVMNELGFVTMDLRIHGLGHWAARLLNGYLEQSGDYEGVAVLRYYQTQCALVRWKIALLRARQLGSEAGAPHERQAEQYMAFALDNIGPAPSALVITHGYSGSGKSTLARQLAELLGGLQIRSDVERKRLFGGGRYDLASTDATYARLCELAAAVARAGLPVIVDAAFLQYAQRRRFAALAGELGLPFFILDIQAGAATLRARVAARAARGDDPSDAGVDVLEQQLARGEPLDDSEQAHALSIDNEGGIKPPALRQACAPVLAVLQKQKTRNSHGENAGF